MKKKNDSSKATRALKACHLYSICAEINSQRTSSGRIPRGEIEKAFITGLWANFLIPLGYRAYPIIGAQKLLLLGEHIMCAPT